MRPSDKAFVAQAAPSMHKAPRMPSWAEAGRAIFGDFSAQAAARRKNCAETLRREIADSPLLALLLLPGAGAPACNIDRPARIVNARISRRSQEVFGTVQHLMVFQ